jgi:hypothetical protein
MRDVVLFPYSPFEAGIFLAWKQCALAAGIPSKMLSPIYGSVIIPLRTRRERDRAMSKDYEGDLQYGMASQIDLNFRTLAAETENVEYRKVAVAFSENLERIISLHSLPVDLIHWAEIMAQSTIMARANAGVPINSNASDPQLASQSQAIFQQIFTEVFRGGLEAGANSVWARGGGILKQLIKAEITDEKDYVIGGISALFASIIILGYAALETLASDLWVIAVNQKPELAANYTEKNPDKQITLDVLKKYNFDLSGVMGHVLKDANRVNFKSLDNIRKAYKDAFKAQLDAAFVPYDDIRHAEKTRHLLAHRGGLIDAKFKEEMAGFEGYGDLEIGKHLLLTGTLVQKHLSTMVQCGIALFRLTIALP